ncbi:hypothetical protein FGG78_28785 [Thioclava sp. BHET1]|nr:hypothetical protein FGG78_28785 [Thioclava sp. BHET1]
MGLVGHVAPILPVILVISAVASQFSASVADSVGAAGLLEGISRGRLSPQHSYPIIALIAILLTWETDVFRLITLASQAFALFYLLQCGVAMLLSWRDEIGPARRRHLLTFGAAGLFCLCVTLLGIPAGA